jgi:hypothetical protein
MTTSDIAVFGLYTNGATDQAVEAFVKAGIRKSDVFVLFCDQFYTRSFAAKHRTVLPAGISPRGSAHEPNIEGSLGIADPAAGPVKGVLPEALMSMGVPEDGVKQYVDRIKEGSVLVSVTCHTLEDTARAIGLIEQTGAEELGKAHRNHPATTTSHPRVRAAGSHK